MASLRAVLWDVMTLSRGTSGGRVEGWGKLFMEQLGTILSLFLFTPLPLPRLPWVRDGYACLVHLSHIKLPDAPSPKNKGITIVIIVDETLDYDLSVLFFSSSTHYVGIG